MDPLQFFVLMLALAVLASAIWQAPALFFGEAESPAPPDPLDRMVSWLDTDPPDRGVVFECNGCRTPLLARVLDGGDEELLDKGAKSVWLHHYCGECIADNHPEYLYDAGREARYYAEDEARQMEDGHGF